MEIVFSRLYHIDYERDIVDEAIMGKNDVFKYIEIIIKKTIENTNSRHFKVVDDNTQVISIINNFVNNIKSGLGLDNTCLDSGTESIARRLSQKEKEKDIIISRMGNHVKKGSLIQSLVRVSDTLYYILSKVEYMEFLDRKESNIRTGLPLEQVILKSCLIKYDEVGICDIKIYDSGNTIADYWSKDLLELVEISSDEANTSASFTSIDRVLGRYIKENYKSDYTLLRNSLIGYYNQNSKFEFTSLIEKVFKNYQPNDITLDMDKIIEKVEKLPENKKFDRVFDIVPKAIRARKKRTIEINPNIELVLKDSTENLKGTIKGTKGKDGEYYLNIRVREDIYRDFYFRD